ncbi:MAG: hypothetical protein PHD65_03110 [Gallionella sp.]|nr:hypothetical protein [Gallionella sp.]
MLTGKAASFAHRNMDIRDVGGILLKLYAVLADKDAKSGNVSAAAF